MKLKSGFKIVMGRIMEKLIGECIGKLYLSCKWSVRIDNWIEDVIYKLSDDWFVE